jgi:dihydroxyacetone kinase-like predicted kinase
VQLLLEALSAVVDERALTVAPAPRPVRDASALVASRETGSAEHEYEVMYLLDASTPERVATLRAELASIGDSVAVVGDGDTWNVHVHCTDVGAAIEAGVDAGRPNRITVIRFSDQRGGLAAHERAVVALAGDDGLARLFAGEGVAVVAGESVDEVRATIAGTRAAHVVVLPNSRGATALAESAAADARDGGHDVVVVPTASPVQGLAALAVHDPARRAGDDVVAMAEAAAATRCGSIAIAEQEALTWAGRCQAGDVLGLVDAEVVLIGADVTEVACALVERMLTAGGELVTALLGAVVPPGLGAALTARLHREHPEVELAVHEGGQDSPLLVGVE